MHDGAGTVIETQEFPEEDVVWILLADAERMGAQASLFVRREPASLCVESGDYLWWRGGWIFWTSRLAAGYWHDLPLRRVGDGSGRARPRLASR